MSDEAAPSLSSRVARGTALIIFARFIIRSLGFINTLVLARLLAPEDFGIVAIGVTVMQLLQNISEIGVSQTIIRYRNAGRRQIDTLFTLSAIKGIAVMALMLLAAPLLGVFYDDPRIFWVFTGMSIVPLFHALNNPRFFEFERDMDYTKDMIATGLNKLVGVAVAITIALIFKTYWAIILGMVAGSFVQLVISYLARPYLPRPTLTAFRELIGFTGWLTGVSFVAALNNKLDVLILGRLLGAAPTGVFYVGAQLAAMPSSEVASPISRALYPGMSQLQSEPERMNHAFLRGVEALGAIAMPASLGCAFVAHDIVMLLLGEKWVDVIPVVQAFAPVIALMSIFAAIEGYAMALGRTKLIFYRALIFFAVRAPLFIWATLEYGLNGAIGAIAVTGIFNVMLNLALYQRVSGQPFWQPLWRVRRSFAGCVAIAAYFFFIRPYAPFIEAAPLIIRLLTDITISATLYGATHLGLWLTAGRPNGIETTMIELAGEVKNKIRVRQT